MNVMHYAIYLFAFLAYLFPCYLVKSNATKRMHGEFYFHLIYAFLSLFEIRICEDPPNANESSTQSARVNRTKVYLASGEKK